MNPYFVFSTSLFVALALWMPTLAACLRGDLPFPTAAIRFLAAFLFTRLALGGISRLVLTYRTTPPPQNTNA
jgi:hypothetical protein